ncbi:phosphoribosylglycinamide formyltransferase [Flavobacterium sp.]|jgi:phosphoribosylglycinamide formyltransferase-1|uniref:phosphoribosylglycinamide formyltransferase n=1 Tax=Flavobacterium sp. TaxID=239 RepID=UPI0026373733|nr:phosphoribosylglycinamide formyltransferase [Flavobacterium sp.]
MSKIVLFASGEGTNAAAIIRHFQEKSSVAVVAVFCNNPQAGVLQRAADFGVPTVLFDRQALEEDKVLLQLQELAPDWIVLAGFLWKFPETILEVFPNVINIHPALLPKFGGKGMYGKHVHEAVLAQGEAVTGITIHYVNAHYDEGAIIAQFETSIADCTTAASIAAKVHALEQEHFPKVIDQLLNS